MWLVRWSAGEHTFTCVCYGSYSEAAVYNIASEVNSWTDYVTGGTALSSLTIGWPFGR